MELTLASGLLAVLGLLLSSMWVSVGRTAADLVGRSRLVQERDLAIAALSSDLGGYSVRPAAQTGEKMDGRWINWQIVSNAQLPTNQDLILTYDGGTDSSGNVLPNSEVRYLVMEDANSGPNLSTLILVRRETPSVLAPASYTDFTVAKNVYSMTVVTDPAESTAVRIMLCFKYRTLTLTCDLTAKQPSTPSATTLPWSINHYTNP